MRYLFLFSILIFNLNSNSQTISLLNDWQKNSSRLYIGVENLLHIQGDINEIVSFSGDITSININNRKDSLLFNVVGPGKKIIKAQFKNGYTQTFSYDALYLPLPVLHFTKEANTYENAINKQDLLTGYILKLCNKDNEIFSDYEVKAYDIIFNKQRVTVSGNTFSPRMVANIETVKQGDSFNIVKVSLFNRYTGKVVHIGLNKKYEVY